MLCNNCGQREVEVLIKQVVNNEVHNLNLCRTCAEEMGFISPDIPSITISFALGEPEIAKQKKIRRIQPRREQNYDLLTCPSCEMPYTEFCETGLLGCPSCYAAFRFPLGAYLQREQGAESHWGGKSEMFSDIAVVEDMERAAQHNRMESERVAHADRLRLEIAEAVSQEEYERAAELRDSLASLLSSNREETDDC